MRTVQQNVFLILNRVPVTFVADPEFIRPSIPVMTHSLDQKVRLCLSGHNFLVQRMAQPKSTQILRGKRHVKRRQTLPAKHGTHEKQ